MRFGIGCNEEKIRTTPAQRDFLLIVVWIPIQPHDLTNTNNYKRGSAQFRHTPISYKKLYVSIFSLPSAWSFLPNLIVVFRPQCQGISNLEENVNVVVCVRR